MRHGCIDYWKESFFSYSHFIEDFLGHVDYLNKLVPTKYILDDLMMYLDVLKDLLIDLINLVDNLKHNIAHMLHLHRQHLVQRVQLLLAASIFLIIFQLIPLNTLPLFLIQIRLINL